MGAGRAATIPATAEEVGHVMILRDITESRRTAQQTIESERLNALRLLAAGVAHEIGNPLNSLHIHLQLMERSVQKLHDGEKAELEQSIDVARSEVNRLDSIVTQFLKAIRPSRPQLRPENVNTIVEEAVRFFAPELQDREIVVEQELRSDLPLLQLDRDQMKQAFYNVIKNSVEAMHRHGTLRIRTDLADTHVIVRFVDTGGGMSAENLSRVFEPYFTTKAIRQWTWIIDCTPHRARARWRALHREQPGQRSYPDDPFAIHRQTHSHVGSRRSQRSVTRSLRNRCN